MNTGWSSLSSREIFLRTDFHTGGGWPFGKVWLAYSVAIAAFALLHPLMEWPDAPIHLADACSGLDLYIPVDLLRSFGQHACSTFYWEDLSFRYFSDKVLFVGGGAINPLWIYFVFPLFFFQLVAFILSAVDGRDFIGNQLVFAPPLAFYLANINQEVVGLWLVLIAYYSLGKRDILAFSLVILAFIIDRSHICSLGTFIAIRFFVPKSRPYLMAVFIFSVLMLYIARLSGYLNIVDVLVEVLSGGEIAGIGSADLYANSEMGHRGYAALLSSAAGLYGAMSIRPVFWPIYYSLFFVFFLVGFFVGRPEDRRLFLVSFFCALTVLLVLPPLSQARYYPVLIISMWITAFKGWHYFGGRSEPVQALYVFWTVMTLLLFDANVFR